MKRWSLLICLALLLCLWSLVRISAGRRANAPELPPEIKSQLDEVFPGWRFSEVREEIRQFLKEEVSPNARPEIVQGDFDGNGSLDYAVLIEGGPIFNSAGEVGGHHGYVVAFLRNADGYKLYGMEAMGEYLTLMRKGEQGYDYETQRHFTYKNDAIGAGIFEKAGVSYIYENGRFRVIITSD